MEADSPMLYSSVLLVAPPTLIVNGLMLWAEALKQAMNKKEKRYLYINCRTGIESTIYVTVFRGKH
jgi:hypothetical protein